MQGCSHRHREIEQGRSRYAQVQKNGGLNPLVSEWFGTGGDLERLPARGAKGERVGVWNLATAEGTVHGSPYSRPGFEYWLIAGQTFGDVGKRPLEEQWEARDLVPNQLYYSDSAHHVSVSCRRIPSDWNAVLKVVSIPPRHSGMGDAGGSPADESSMQAHPSQRSTITNHVIDGCLASIV